jgi:hypothetical protein
LANHKHHNHLLDPSASVAIFVNMDEVNNIFDGLNKGSAVEMPNTLLQPLIAKTVIPLVAGTSRRRHEGKWHQSSLTTLLALSPDEVIDLLGSCGVNAKYFSDPVPSNSLGKFYGWCVIYLRI